MRYPRYPVLRHIPFFHQRERGIELAGFYDLGYPQNSPINQNKINICTVVATAIAILWDCKYLTDGIHCWKITWHLENGVTNRWFRYDRLGPAVQLHQCTNNNYGMEVSTGGTPIASWFRMENPMKECMSLGVPPFRKPPICEAGTSCIFETFLVCGFSPPPNIGDHESFQSQMDWESLICPKMGYQQIWWFFMVFHHISHFPVAILRLYVPHFQIL